MKIFKEIKWNFFKSYIENENEWIYYKILLSLMRKISKFKYKNANYAI